MGIGIAVVALAVAVIGVACVKRVAQARPAGAPRDDAGDPGARLDAFWTWWRTAAPRIAAAFDARDGRAIAGELGDRIAAIDPRLAWETGPGLEGARHHLALSSEGDPTLRVLVERWLSRAPPPDAAWEYYPARQAPPDDARFSMSLDAGANTVVDFADVRVGLETDPAREVVDVTIHHPALGGLEEQEQLRVAFLVLDNVVGEDGVERWLRRIRPSVEPIPDGKPLRALAEAVAALERTATGEQYAVLEGRTPAGRPVVAMANVAVKKVDHLLMDHHLQVAVPFRTETAEGTPSPEENGELNALEDELLAALGHDAVFVAHETGDGRRTIHLHVAGPGPAEQRATEWARRHVDRGIELELRADAAWDVLDRWR
jgi:hypothetical protein